MLDELIERAKAKGSDKAFREWIQRQPSCLSGQFSEFINGEGRCIAAHVRRSKDSGTGFKAPYACVPLTNEEHLRSHQHGDSVFHPKLWWDQQRIRYLRMWVES